MLHFHMQTVESHTEKTLEVKQSKFIAHLMPYHMYEKVLEALKAEHPKARHFVSAWRHLNEFDQVVEYSTDDGEPKGTSGRPTLTVLQGHELINTAVIIVRYFGGTKLGTGGLVRAYSDAANLVISASDLLLYEKEETHAVSVAYNLLGMVEYEVKQCGLNVADKSFEAAEAVLTLKGTPEAFVAFFAKAERMVSRRP
jgi:uncharacterized YigZ family protein